MKTAFGLAACACLTLSLAAFADKPEKPRYKPNGDRCTAEEVATGATLKTNASTDETRRVYVDCRTRTEWSIAAGEEHQRASDQTRYDINRLGRGYGYPAYVSPPRGVSSYSIATSPPAMN